MDHGRDILVLGWRGPLPECYGFRVHCVRTEELRFELAVARKSSGAVLLIGDQALESTAPGAILGPARWPWCITVVVRGKASMETALRWRDAGAQEFIEERDLGRRLRAFAERPYRGDIPFEAWAPPSRGDSEEARDLLLMVPELHELTVDAWAAQSKRSERTLRNDCRKLFGAQPKDVLWGFADTSFRAGRAAGRSAVVMSHVLGYFDEANLRRAYRRRGLRFPG